MNLPGAVGDFKRWLLVLPGLGYGGPEVAEGLKIADVHAGLKLLAVIDYVAGSKDEADP